MDKYEYKLKTEQMLELMEDGAYRKAAEIADSIDWKRVRNAAMLTNVSDIYEKNKEYQKSYDVLNLAYRRAEGSRKIISRLCTLALKTGNVDEAIDYYDDFTQIAPKDPNQYILRYQILRAQRAPIEQQIEALEEYKKSEYIEEWAYELAKLYQEAGMTAECLEECDDLILWFSEGQYVYKAMELKMQYKPLTPSQQEKYDRRYEKLSAETEEMPDIATYAEAKTDDEDDASEFFAKPVSEEETKAEEADGDKQVKEAAESVADEEHDEEPVSNDPAPAPRKKIGNTMPLNEALRQLLHHDEEDASMESDSSDQAVSNEIDEDEAEPLPDDLEKAIGEIESVADMEMVNRLSDEKKRKTVSSASGMKEIIPDDDQIEGQINLDDILTGWEGAPEESDDQDKSESIITENEIREAEELPTEELELEEAEDFQTEEIDLTEAEELLTEEINLTEAEEIPAEEIELEEAEEVPAEVIELEEAEEIPVEEIEPEEAEEIPAEEIELEEAEEIPVEEIEPEEAEEVPMEENELNQAEDLTENIAEGDTTGDKMENKKTEPILPPDIQRMIDEIEGVIPREEEKPKPTGRYLKRPVEEPHENMGKLADDLRMDEDFEEDDYFDELDEISEEENYFDDAEALTGEEDYFDEAEELPEEENYFDEAEELSEEEDYFDEAEELSEEEDYFDETEELSEEEDYFDESEELSEEEDYFDETEELPEEEDYFDESEELPEEEDYFDESEEFPEEEDYFDDGEDLDNVPDLEEEFRVNPEHTSEPDDREIPDDDDDGMDILSATTPLSRKETAKLIATGKTAPLPLDEISDALSMTDTGFIVHGRYDLETQSGIGTRAGLTEEQKKLFSYFVPVRGMSEQLVDVLEQDKNCTNRAGTSKTGNLLIIGNKGNGKTVLAVDVVKAIQKQRNIRQGKVAIVTGDSLNKKKISDIFDKLHGGALIIEKAGKMNEKTVARLNKAMERDTGELLIVLEEQRKPLDRLLSSNREFRRKFTSRLEVPIFINDELVTFGQTYAQENGYRIDEMGILALYSRIDSLQREDHAVTVAEVKEIMDEAIQHSQKASAKKLVKRVFGKNTDDADRILLSEKDFNI